MAYEYYKALLKEAVDSAEFSEHQDKHCMSAEETKKTVEEDLRHDPVSRFLVTKEASLKILHFLIDSESQPVKDWCRRMSEAEVGEYIHADYDIGPLPTVTGERYTMWGVETCHSLHLAFSFKKGSRPCSDRARIVTFFPSADK